VLSLFVGGVTACSQGPSTIRSILIATSQRTDIRKHAHTHRLQQMPRSSSNWVGCSHADSASAACKSRGQGNGAIWRSPGKVDVCLRHQTCSRPLSAESVILLIRAAGQFIVLNNFKMFSLEVRLGLPAASCADMTLCALLLQATATNCPYSTLGVKANASDNDIKQAYRKLVLQYHPDVNHASNAERRFMSIQQAYELLTGKARGADGRDGQRGDWAFHDCKYQ